MQAFHNSFCLISVFDDLECQLVQDLQLEKRILRAFCVFYGLTSCITIEVNCIVFLLILEGVFFFWNPSSHDPLLEPNLWHFCLLVGACLGLWLPMLLKLCKELRLDLQYVTNQFSSLF